MKQVCNLVVRPLSDGEREALKKLMKDYDSVALMGVVDGVNKACVIDGKKVLDFVLEENGTYS